jgi:two-component system sensor histidine kinase YesM
MFVRVPALILQPIVENAIKYNLEAETDSLHVSIDAAVRNHDIVIHVRDTGVGMTEAQLERVRAGMDGANPTADPVEGGHGLSNINARLRYTYGDAYGVEVESREREYTRMTIRIPLDAETSG